MSAPIFDFTISNPPYQRETLGTAPNIGIYPEFLLFSSIVSNNTIMIHPARSFRGASKTNKRIVNTIKNDTKFKVVFFDKNDNNVFPNTKIEGGIIIVNHTNNHIKDSMNINMILDSILLNIKNKVNNKTTRNITERYHLSTENKVLINDKYIGIETNFLNKYPKLWSSNSFPNSIPVLGRYNSQRVIAYIDDSIIRVNNDWVDNYKVVVPVSNGGKTFGKPLIADKGLLCSKTFFCFGFFKTREEAVNLYNYLNTNFVKTLLSILKVTQHNNKNTWVNVPDLIDYSDTNDNINWNEPLEEQLVSLYELSEEEAEYIGKLF